MGSCWSIPWIHLYKLRRTHRCTVVAVVVAVAVAAVVVAAVVVAVVAAVGVVTAAVRVCGGGEAPGARYRAPGTRSANGLPETISYVIAISCIAAGALDCLILALNPLR